MQGFTVTLNSQEVIDKATGQTLSQFLGRGFVVDIIKEKSVFQFSNTETHIIGYDDKGEPVEKEVTGIRSLENTIVKYIVLWEGNPEPKIHDSKTLNWEMTNDQYKSNYLSETDDEEEEELKRVAYYNADNTVGVSDELYSDIESFYGEYPDATFIGFIDEDEDMNDGEENTSTETENETETLS